MCTPSHVSSSSNEKVSLGNLPPLPSPSELFITFLLKKKIYQLPEKIHQLIIKSIRICYFLSSELKNSFYPPLKLLKKYCLDPTLYRILCDDIGKFRRFKIVITYLSTVLKKNENIYWNKEIHNMRWLLGSSIQTLDKKVSNM